jgi:thymidine kinase
MKYKVSMSGELNLVIGPMYSGKSTELLRIYNKFKRNYKILVINHQSDNRYGNNSVNTHNEDSIESISTEELCTINMGLLTLENDIILIDEGQFFNDLYVFCKNIVEKHNKIVYVFGLSGDSCRKKFGQILDLIPICDNIKHLKSICNKCENVKDASFTLRTSNSIEQVSVGGSEEYMAVCRKCWLSNH